MAKFVEKSSTPSVPTKNPASSVTQSQTESTEGVNCGDSSRNDQIFDETTRSSRSWKLWTRSCGMGGRTPKRGPGFVSHGRKL